MTVRWLLKANGEKVLQQQIEVDVDTSGQPVLQWADVEAVDEEREVTAEVPKS